MTTLADFIQPRAHFARSINLERDLDEVDVLRGYIPSATSLEALSRILRGISTSGVNRAWSLTGPYGSGKSSLAQFLLSLLGPSGSMGYKAAQRVLRHADSQVNEAFLAVRKKPKTRAKGFIRAATAAEYGPVTESLIGALANGCRDYWSGPGRKPALVTEVESLAEGDDPLTSGDFVDLIRELGEVAPIAIVLDEMGKAFEFAAAHPEESDLYVLQQVAELLSGAADVDGLLLTLQHLAVDDYSIGVSETHRREWSKVHGRFEDIPFVETDEQALRLLASVFQVVNPPRGFKTRLAEWVKECEKALEALDAKGLLPSEGDVLAAAYPLHPACLLVLPELCARFGQHDRTLFTFVTSPTRNSILSYMAGENFNGRELPIAALDRIFDYFIESLSSGASNSGDTSRWLEIQSRVREAGDLNVEELRCLKTIGVLNLVADRGPRRASKKMVEFALSTPGKSSRSAIRKTIGKLQGRGLLTYVEFADEYRVWRGTDFDVRGAMDAARQRLAHTSLVEHLSRAHPLRPVVARRHSQQSGTLRYFECRYVERYDASEIPACFSPEADGLLLYVLEGHGGDQSVTSLTGEGRPLIVVLTPDAAELRQAALDCATLIAVLEETKELAEDKVARAEITRRIVIAQSLLDERLRSAFDPSREGVSWIVNGDSVVLDGLGALTSLLSDLCDEVYFKTPKLHNEMLNRRELTSQGAKTRRELVEAMILRSDQPHLGIQGHGPDWAMYQSVLAQTGIHKKSKDDQYQFGKPRRASGLETAWSTIQGFFDSTTESPLPLDHLYDELMSPPIGMKRGAIPVLLVAALIARADDVSLYQEGSFQPMLTTEVSERLIKAPERFSVKNLRIAGIRQSVFSELQTLLSDEADQSSSAPYRNNTLLSVVRPLISFVRSLPPYVLKTKSISPVAHRVRVALLNSREPDDLLFRMLPEACGSKPFTTSRTFKKSEAKVFCGDLRSALFELREAYNHLIGQIGESIATAFDIDTSGKRMREELRSRSRRLAAQVIDSRLRSFLLTAANADLDDQEWLEAVAMNLGGKPPQGWTDEDWTKFEAGLVEISRRFRRVEALHYEMNTPESEGFDARKVTVTHPDGNEVTRVVWLDETKAAPLSLLLDEMLAAAEKQFGHEAGLLLLARLATAVVDSERLDPHEASVAPERSTKHD